MFFDDDDDDSGDDHNSDCSPPHANCSFVSCDCCSLRTIIIVMVQHFFMLHFSVTASVFSCARRNDVSCAMLHVLVVFQPTAAAMFEHACSDRIRQFDATDSDEELWEDKDVTFTHLSDVRHRCVVVLEMTH